jgi:hypothetical protein
LPRPFNISLIILAIELNAEVDEDMKTLRYVKLYKYVKIGAVAASIAIPIALAIGGGSPKDPPPDAPF